MGDVLKNPKLWERITLEELDKKVVGEIEARQTIFLTINMRNVENLSKGTDNLIVNAESGSGKDFVGEAVFGLIPESEKEELIQTTPKVLAYTRNREIKGCENSTWKKVCLRLEDVSRAVLRDDSFKVKLSSNPNGINNAKSVIRQAVVPIVTEGKPSIVMTIAHLSLKDELLRRCPIVYLDESQKQTKEIIKRQAEFAKNGKSIDYDEEIKLALMQLKRVKVKIPYADDLVKIFSPQEILMRTHFPRFLDYIKASCSLYQYQREVDSEGFYIATPQDYEIARIALKATTTNIFMIPLTKRQADILKGFNQNNLTEQSVVDLETQNFIQRLDITEEWLRKQLDFLASKGFLIKNKEIRATESGRKASKPTFVYSFNEIQKVEIPTWEELENFKLPEIPPKIAKNGVNELFEQVFDIRHKTQNQQKLTETSSNSSNSSNSSTNNNNKINSDSSVINNNINNNNSVKKINKKKVLECPKCSSKTFHEYPDGSSCCGDCRERWTS